MCVKTPLGLTMDETTYPQCDEDLRALSCSAPSTGWMAQTLNKESKTMNCDGCGRKTTCAADGSGIILCDDCKHGRKQSALEIIAELEAEGIDVKAFLARVHATIERSRSKWPSNVTGEPEEMED